MEDKTCHMCLIPIGIKNKTGRCRPCNTKLWLRNNRTHMIEKTKQWMIENPNKQKEYNSRNYAKNKKTQIAYKKQKYNNDPIFRLRHVLRNRLHCAVKRESKAGSAIRDLGCSIEFLKAHLESKFLPGMSWDNYGKWHIDHIVPLNSFDLTDEKHVKIVCNYNNLQPLWAEDNIKKGDK